MEGLVRAYQKEDLPGMTILWNEVVRAGNAFPQENLLTLEESTVFFGEQSFTGVVEEGGKIVGLYILHPNNIGRCGHLANASYAVLEQVRGQGVGERLVKHCLEQGRVLGFKVLQFNAVVCSNVAALRLYKKLGFVKLGTVPEGFKNAEGVYEDICLFYKQL